MKPWESCAELPTWGKQGALPAPGPVQCGVSSGIDRPTLQPTHSLAELLAASQLWLCTRFPCVLRLLPALPRPGARLPRALQLQLNLGMNVPAGKLCGQKQFWTYGQAQTCAWVKTSPCLLCPPSAAAGGKRWAQLYLSPVLAFPQRYSFVTATQCHSDKQWHL